MHREGRSRCRFQAKESSQRSKDDTCNRMFSVFCSCHNAGCDNRQGTHAKTSLLIRLLIRSLKGLHGIPIHSLQVSTLQQSPRAIFFADALQDAHHFAIMRCCLFAFSTLYQQGRQQVMRLRLKNAQSQLLRSCQAKVKLLMCPVIVLRLNHGRAEIDGTFDGRRLQAQRVSLFCQFFQRCDGIRSTPPGSHRFFALFTFDTRICSRCDAFEAI